jgi:hypothetical protein
VNLDYQWLIVCNLIETRLPVFQSNQKTFECSGIKRFLVRVANHISSILRHCISSDASGRWGRYSQNILCQIEIDGCVFWLCLLHEF